MSKVGAWGNVGSFGASAADSLDAGRIGAFLGSVGADF